MMKPVITGWAIQRRRGPGPVAAGDEAPLPDVGGREVCPDGRALVAYLIDGGQLPARLLRQGGDAGDLRRAAEFGTLPDAQFRQPGGHGATLPELSLGGYSGTAAVTR